MSLYLLLMERYGQDVDLGLLWNIHNTGMQAVKKVGGAPAIVSDVACKPLRCAHSITAGLTHATFTAALCQHLSYLTTPSLRCTTRWQL